MCGVQAIVQLSKNTVPTVLFLRSVWKYHRLLIVSLFLLVMLDIELSSDSDDDAISVTDDRPPGSNRWALEI
jgi:hypothetical protein